MKVKWSQSWMWIFFLVFFILIGANITYGMEIKIVVATGQALTVQAEPEQTVADVKKFVFTVTSIHMGNQRMFKSNLELDNSMTLASYNITDGDTLHIKHGVVFPHSEEKKSGGLLKTVIVIVILAGIFFIVKKTLLKPKLRS